MLNSLQSALQLMLLPNCITPKAKKYETPRETS